MVHVVPFLQGGGGGGWIFTPPPEIRYLACYCVNILSLYFLQMLSFTSIQLNKSDVDMEGALISEKV